MVNQLDEFDKTSPEFEGQVDHQHLQETINRLEQENGQLRAYFSTLAQNMALTDPAKSIESIQQIEEQNYQYYQALMSSNSGIAILSGPQHIYEFVNPAYERIAGRSKETLLSRSARAAFPEVEGQGMFEIMDEVVRTGQPFSSKEKQLHIARLEDGKLEEIFSNITYYPLFDLEGKVAGFVSQVLDVSEEVRVRQTLEHQHLRLQQLFEAAPASIAVLGGPDHVFEIANPLYLQLVRRPASSIIGYSVAEALPEVVEQGFISLLDTVYRTGQPFIGQEIKVQLDLNSQQSIGGESKLSEVYLNFVYQPIFRPSGSEVEGIFVHAVDVSEQVKARHQVEKLSNLKDDFLAMASHDLRNPITALRGYAQLLQRSLAKFQQTQLTRASEVDSSPTHTLATSLRESEVKFLDNSLQLATTVLNQTNRLNALVERLFDFTQITEGQLHLQYTNGVDLVQVAQEVVGAMNVTSDTHQVLMQPPAQTSIRVSCDVTRVEQVLNNLIANSIKYSAPNTTITLGLELATPNPSVQAEREGEEEVVMWVGDEGYGISPQHQLHLFERFYRVRSEQNANKSGLGLGLYISNQIIKQHGGRLWVESEVGRGSTFFIALPISRTGLVDSSQV